MLPNFIIGGTQKSGTTFFYNLVKNHSNVKMPSRSMDRSFFDDDRVYKHGLDWYKKLFEEFEGSEHIVGQISADCSFNLGSIERIKKDIPNAKLIFVLRHPVDRLYSQYWFMYGNGVEYKKINSALNSEANRVNKNYYNYKMYSYLGRSKYKSQFEEVFKHFDERDILLIPFDNLIKDTLRTLNVAFEFIGVDDIKTLDELKDDSVSKNPALLPINHTIALVSYYLQKIGLKRLGKILINKNRKQERPPKITDKLLVELQGKLKEDIAFFEKVKTNFSNKYL